MRTRPCAARVSGAHCRVTNSGIGRLNAANATDRRSSARVAQLDRASASGAEGCGFDPRLAYQFFRGLRRSLSARPSTGAEVMTEIESRFKPWLDDKTHFQPVESGLGCPAWGLADERKGLRGEGLRTRRRKSLRQEKTNLKGGNARDGQIGKRCERRKCGGARHSSPHTPGSDSIEKGHGAVPALSFSSSVRPCHTVARQFTGPAPRAATKGNPVAPRPNGPKNTAPPPPRPPRAA